VAADVTRRTAAIGTALALCAPAASARVAPLRLTARPGAGGVNRPGTRRLGGSALLYVPKRAAGRPSAPLLVMLHGAAGDAWSGFDLVRRYAEQAGVMVLAPTSWGLTWALNAEGTGRLDRLLSLAFKACAPDPRAIAIGGYSDGASAALSWGLSNGDLFSGVAAFTAGGVRAPERVGRPRVFMSHGEQDHVLPIVNAEAIARALRAMGYEVRFERYHGGHETVPSAEVRAAFETLFPQAPAQAPAQALVSMVSPPVTPALA
jgi:predicted esterase